MVKSDVKIWNVDVGHWTDAHSRWDTVQISVEMFGQCDEVVLSIQCRRVIWDGP